jgi:membrane dipeptidase
MIDLFYKWKEANPEVSIILSGHDLKEVKNGRCACLLSIEGGEALAGKLFMLDVYYRLGVRAMTLTWSNRNLLADGVSVGNNPGGLTCFGEEVVNKMNSLGMIVDVSHMAERGFWDVMKLSKEPVIASHSNCYSLHNHPRNLKDEQILAIAEKGGVTGITFVPHFLGENPVTVEHVADHIEYIVNLTGNYEAVGLGSDFHGTDNYPFGLSDASLLPSITEVLNKRGHSYKDIEKIIGKNWLRVLSQILKEIVRK